VFRRNSASPGAGTAPETGQAAEGTGTDSPDAPDALSPSRATTPGKGRPTPKRSEAQRNRRAPYTAPQDRKQAGRQSRDNARADRIRRSDAMRRGEEWALPARDKGPAKALARDYVDSRRRVSEFYMYGLLVLLAVLFIHVTAVQAIVPFVVLAAIVVMLTEGWYVSRRARLLVQQRYPGESTRGIRWYAAVRSLQIRQLRMPKPRIKPGDSY
jgi:hypothetical protein